MINIRNEIIPLCCDSFFKSLLSSSSFSYFFASSLSLSLALFSTSNFLSISWQRNKQKRSSLFIARRRMLKRKEQKKTMKRKKSRRRHVTVVTCRIVRCQQHLTRASVYARMRIFRREKKK